MTGDTLTRAPLRHPAASRWVAVALFLLSLAMVAFNLASLVLPGSERLPDRPSLITFIAWAFVFISFPAVGAVVATRRPGNPIGWLLLVIGICFTSSVMTTEYVGRALYLGAALPAVEWVDWWGAWSFLLGAGLLFVWVPLLFPTGHLPGSRWRAFAWVAGITIAAGLTANAVLPGPLPGDPGTVLNPVGAPAVAADIVGLLSGLAFPAIAILGLVSIGSLIVRFRRTGDEERQQIKWLLFAVSALIATLVPAWFTQLTLRSTQRWSRRPRSPRRSESLVLRYRLYEIDRIVSRTIAYAIITGILGAAFVITILAVQTLLASYLPSQTIAVAASTLVAAATIPAGSSPRAAPRGPPLRPGAVRRRPDRRRLCRASPERDRH